MCALFIHPMAPAFALGPRLDIRTHGRPAIRDGKPAEHATEPSYAHGDSGRAIRSAGLFFKRIDHDVAAAVVRAIRAMLRKRSSRKVARANVRDP